MMPTIIGVLAVVISVILMFATFYSFVRHVIRKFELWRKPLLEFQLNFAYSGSTISFSDTMDTLLDESDDMQLT